MATKRKKLSGKNKAGRLLFEGKDEKHVVSILSAAFQRGATDEMAANYAEISLAALYRYEDKHPEFRERKHLLKTSLSMRALNRVAEDIDKSVETAKWYLTRKMPQEFGDKLTTDNKHEVTHNLGEIAKTRLKKYVR